MAIGKEGDLMKRFLLVGGLWFSATAQAAVGQQPLPATTVQLPTVSQFSVRTTVSVPDGGTMSMGGVSRGYDSRVNRGMLPLGSRGIATGRTAGGVSVSTRIIDHAEMDRAILASAAAERGALPGASAAKSASLSRPTQPASPAPASVAAIRQANALAAERDAAELADLFAKAQAAEATGKTGAAKVYYQMVARRDRGQLQSLAQARLTALTRK